MPEGDEGESQASDKNGDWPDRDIFRGVVPESLTAIRSLRRSVDLDLFKSFAAHHSVRAQSLTQPTQPIQHGKPVVNPRTQFCEGTRQGRDSPQHLLQLLVDLVEPGFQFLALGVIDGGGKALDQILELHAAQVELHR